MIGRRRTRSSSRRGRQQRGARAVLVAALAASPVAMASCISLQGSTMCPAFASASISTDGFVAGRLYVPTSLPSSFALS